MAGGMLPAMTDQHPRFRFHDQGDGRIFVEHLQVPRFRGLFAWRSEVPEFEQVIDGPHDQTLVGLERLDPPVFNRDEVERALSIEFGRSENIDNP